MLLNTFYLLISFSYLLICYLLIYSLPICYYFYRYRLTNLMDFYLFIYEYKYNYYYYELKNSMAD